MNKKNVKRSIFSYVFIVAVLICLYYAFVSFRNVNNQLSYDEFMSNLNKGTIEKLEITPSNYVNIIIMCEDDVVYTYISEQEIYPISLSTVY